MADNVTSLGDLLSQEQLNEVVRILSQPKDTLAKTADLKAYLKTFAAELEAKRVLSEYLAYWLLANEEMIVASVRRWN